MFAWDVHVWTHQCIFLAEKKTPYIYVFHYVIYYRVWEIRFEIVREGGWGTLIENVVRFCRKIMLQLLSTENIYDHLTASKTTLGNPVPIIVVIWKDVQIPQMRYLVTFEIFRGTQEIGVEMIDGTEDLWDTRALLEQLEVSLDTPVYSLDWRS